MLTKFASSVHEQSMSLYVRVRQSVGRMELSRDQEVSQSNGLVLKRQRNYRVQAHITCSFLLFASTNNQSHYLQLPCGGLPGSGWQSWQSARARAPRRGTTADDPSPSDCGVDCELSMKK